MSGSVTESGHQFELPEGWEWKRLGDMAEFTRKPRQLAAVPEIPFVTMAHISERSFALNDWEVRQPPNVRSGTYFESGDVLLARITPCFENGKLAVAPAMPNGWGYATTEVYPLRSQHLLPQYLAHYLKSNRARGVLLRAMEGATGRMRVPKEALEELLLPVPPLEQQRQIVSWINDLRARGASTDASIFEAEGRLRALRRSTLDVALAGRLAAAGRSGGSRSGLPEDWEWKPLGDLAEVVRGLTYKKDQVGSPNAVDHVPLLRATNITEAGLVLDDFVWVPRALVKAPQFVRPGDLVVAASSGSRSVVGKAAPVVKPFDGTFGAFCAVVRPSDHIEPDFLYWFMMSDQYRQRVSSLAAGSNINNLKREHLLGMPVPVPAIEEQRRIVETLARLWIRLSKVQDSLLTARHRLNDMDRAISHRAFRGEIGELSEERVGA